MRNFEEEVNDMSVIKMADLDLKGKRVLIHTRQAIGVRRFRYSSKTGA